MSKKQDIKRGLLEHSHRSANLNALEIWWKVKLIPCGKGEIHITYVSGLSGMTKEEVQKNLSGNGYFAVARSITYDRVVKETYNDMLN